ncbi:MAG: DUF5916 domain-containing protein [Bacteroidales bacterium]
MIRSVFLLLLLLIAAEVGANTPKKNLVATRTVERIRIDGHLDEAAWAGTATATGFITYSPKMGDPATHSSVVRVVYDNQAVYIGALLYDSAPDSILREFTKRDNFSNANTDKFRVTLNPYNDGQNLYHFEVSAANVQADYKKSAAKASMENNWESGDYSWNAVWTSAVRITDEGWVVEMEIPFAAIRFPRQDVQTWGVNFQRTVRRSREITVWNPVDRSFSEDDQIGEMTGISLIKAPLRLELYPFASGYYQITPDASGFSYAAGMDLKYGINEAYTLDMTLIPDFGQRKSDQIILNLTPYEVKYTENRQFFTEGMELFNKSDLFYSRRIGKQPLNYREAWSAVQEGETLVENPGETRLINATKISGRNSRNLGLGFFNAMTANTYAIILDTTKVEGEGSERRYLTDPFTNYSMVVVDQIIGRNSYVNFSNTNVITPSTTRMANVTSLMTRLMDRDNRYGVSASLAGSMKYDSLSGKPSNGYAAKIGFGKYRGTLTAGYNLVVVSDTYDPNDMGYLKKNNYISHSFDISHRVLEPFWVFNSLSNSLEVDFGQIYNPLAFYQLTAGISTRLLFRDYSDISVNLYGSPIATHDWYEPRVPGRYFSYPAYYSASVRGSSDYRKKLAFNAGVGYNENAWGDHGVNFSFGPRLRLNNKLSLFPSFRFDKQFDDRGYVRALAADSILFGRRNVKTITNSITGSYVFNNKAALSLSLRHYWSEVDYHQFFLLNEDGSLRDNETYAANHDLNFNIFTIDLEYAWNFAPGSYLTAVWKNNISSQVGVDGNQFISYWDNLQNTIFAPQVNSFSVKVSYYLDYHRFARRPAP